MAGSKYVPQQTLQYSTFIKRALTESIQDSFAVHPDKTVQNTKAAIDFTHDRFRLPAVIIKFNDPDIYNAGVGHVEWLPDPNLEGQFIKYMHRIYQGEVTFEIWGMTAVDRDLVRDALIEILLMTDPTSTIGGTTTQGDAFIQRLYYYLNSTPYGLWHFPVLNLDELHGRGERTSIAPWIPEDVLVYQVSYSMPIFGEFYSITPPEPTTYGKLTEVDFYPQQVDTSGNPIDPAPGAYPDPLGYWYSFTGWPSPPFND